MTRSLGIDIGSYSIKIAEVDYTGKESIVLGLFEIAITPEDNPADKLKTFFNSGTVRPDRVSVGLGNTPVLVKKVYYPFGDRRKVEQALMGEFEDSIPFDLDDYLLEFQRLGKVQKSHVFLAGLCHKSNVAQINSYFENSETIPSAFCLDNEMLARLAIKQNRSEDQEAETFCICDVGFQSTKLAIVKEIPKSVKTIKDLAQNIIEVRTLGKGALEIYDWMDSQRNMSMADCEQWLTHRAKIKNTDDEGEKQISDETSDDVKTALKPVLVEIYQTLQALKSKQGVTPSYLLLTGGLTQLPGFAEFFSREMRIETRVWDPLEGFEVNPSLITKNKRNRFSMALALAERFRPSKLPQSFNFRRSSLADRRLLSGSFDALMETSNKPLMVGFVVTFAIFMVYQFASGFFVNQEKDGIRSELIANFRTLDPVLGKRAVELIDDLDRAEEMFEAEKQRQLKNLDPSRPARSDLLLLLSQSLPPSVVTQRLQIQDGPKSSTAMSVEISMPTDWAQDRKNAFQETLMKNLEVKGFSDFIRKTSGNTLKLEAKWQESM